MKLALVSANKILLSKSRPWPLSHEFRSRIKAICWLVTSDYLKPEKAEFLQHVCQPYPKTIVSDVKVVNQLPILEISDTIGHYTAHPLR